MNDIVQAITMLAVAVGSLASAIMATLSYLKGRDTAKKLLAVDNKVVAVDKKVVDVDTKVAAVKEQVVAVDDKVNGHQTDMQQHAVAQTEEIKSLNSQLAEIKQALPKGGAP